MLPEIRNITNDGKNLIKNFLKRVSKWKKKYENNHSVDFSESKRR